MRLSATCFINDVSLLGAQNGYTNRPPNYNQRVPSYSSYPGRYIRDTETSVPDITFDTRIAGKNLSTYLTFAIRLKNTIHANSHVS